MICIMQKEPRSVVKLEESLVEVHKPTHFHKPLHTQVQASHALLWYKTQLLGLYENAVIQSCIIDSIIHYASRLD